MDWVPGTARTRFTSALSNQLVCVTGGAGFIGGHLVDALVALGARVTVIDDLSNSDAAHLAKVIDACPEQIRFVQGSILDPVALSAAVEGSRCVFHLAALGSVPRSVEDPARTWVVNATGTMRVLSAAHKAGARRVVYSASSSAYGNNPDLPKVESMACEPESPYAASKVAGEALCRSWSGSYGLDTVSLRYFNIFGPRQRAGSAYAAAIPAFLSAYADGRSPTIFGSGEQTRDFTHVHNAVFANLLAAVHDGTLGGEVLNVGAGKRTSVNELARILGEHAGGGEIAPVHAPERAGEVMHSVADIDAIRARLGYEIVTGMEEGLESTARWFVDRLSRSHDRAEGGERS
jgi:nucleoside-diphosphate-sugar epimerase